MDIKTKAVLAAKTKVLKALAHPARLWMVEQLDGGERCVCELVDGIGLDFSTVSRHLLVLYSSRKTCRSLPWTVNERWPDLVSAVTLVRSVR